MEGLGWHAGEGARQRAKATGTANFTASGSRSGRGRAAVGAVAPLVGARVGRASVRPRSAPTPTVTIVGRPECSTVASPSVATLCSLASWSGQPARETTSAGVVGRPAGRDEAARRARRAACRPCRTTRCRRGGRRRARRSSSSPSSGRRCGRCRGASAAVRVGRGGERGGDAGDDLALDAGGGERLQLFLEAAEDARVAALQARRRAAASARA